MLKKKINFKKVKRVVIGGSVKRLREEALNIETGIQWRTQSGKDMNLRAFKPYSSAYAKRKGSRSVDLTVSNNMLHAISSKKIPNGLRFYFNASSETKKAAHNQKTRKFFGVDKTQIKYLKKQMGKLK